MLVACKYILDRGSMRSKEETLTRIDLDGMVAEIDLVVAQDDSREPRLYGERSGAGYDDAHAWRDRRKDIRTNGRIDYGFDVVKETVAKDEFLSMREENGELAVCTNAIYDQALRALHIEANQRVPFWIGYGTAQMLSKRD